jgi:elongation factor Ts
MANITAVMVKELRQITDQAMMDCKRALQKTDGDFDKAIEILREKGQKIIAKRGDRDANEGKVVTHKTDDGKTATMVLLASETDFTSKNDEFGVIASGISEGLLAHSGVPADLEALGTVAIGDRTVADAVNDIVAKIGEKISVTQFAKYELAGSGLIHTYVHFNNRVGTIIELTTGSEEAAASEALQTLAGDICMHITAIVPEATCLSRQCVDAAQVEEARATAREEVKGKPENIIERIVDGKMDKFFADFVLLEQPFVKDDKKKVQEVISDLAKKLGTQITLTRFNKIKCGS